MIVYERLWSKMEEQGYTTYTLRNKYGMSCRTVQRLQENKPVSTVTLDRLCEIFECQPNDLVQYIPDKSKTY